MGNISNDTKDLLFLIEKAERQIEEVKHHLGRGCHISANAKICFAIRPLKQVEDFLKAEALKNDQLERENLKKYFSEND